MTTTKVRIGFRHIGWLAAFALAMVWAAVFLAVYATGDVFTSLVMSGAALIASAHILTWNDGV